MNAKLPQPQSLGDINSFLSAFLATAAGSLPFYLDMFRMKDSGAWLDSDWNKITYTRWEANQPGKHANYACSKEFHTILTIKIL